MVIIKNNHEPIITQEVWDKCREVEASVSQGKKTKSGFVAPLSGLLFCADCGEKMRLGWSYSHYKDGTKGRKRNYFNCGNHNRFGKFVCTSHYIKMETLNEIVLQDIRFMAQLVVSDEEYARSQFIAYKERFNSHQTETEEKRLRDGKHRLEELKKLISSIYEDKVLGKIPEDVCVNLLEKYQTEQKELSAEVEALEAKLSAVKQDENDVEEFIRRLKKYTDVQELTREICLELIEYVTVDACPSDKKQPRTINIYYKLLDKRLKSKHSLTTEETAISGGFTYMFMRVSI